MGRKRVCHYHGKIKSKKIRVQRTQKACAAIRQKKTKTSGLDGMPNQSNEVSVEAQNVAEPEPSTSSSIVEPLLMEVSEEVVPRKRIPKPKGSRELEGLGQVLRKSRRQEKEEAKRKKEEERQNRLREKEKKLREKNQREKEAKADLLTYMNCLGELSPHYLGLTAKKQRMFRQAAIMFLNEMLDEQEAETEAT